MSSDLATKIERAKELLHTSRHVALATVNEDGSPHNSPVRFIFHPKLEYIYWASNPESLHSKNIIRTGQVFAVLYDRIERGGLYMKAENGHDLADKELEEALKIHNDFRIKEGSEPLALDYYSPTSPQRMWGAKITSLSVNFKEKGPDGHLIKDGRIEISKEDLLK